MASGGYWRSKTSGGMGADEVGRAVDGGEMRGKQGEPVDGAGREEDGLRDGIRGHTDQPSIFSQF